MKRFGMALLVGLGIAFAVTPAEVWDMLAQHQEVKGYTATVAQGPIVYKVAFLRPKVRLEWVKGPSYLVGQVMIVDGNTLWSRGKDGKWKKTRGAAPLDPVHLLFSDFEKLKANYELEVLGQDGDLLKIALIAKAPPDKGPARWVFEVHLPDHRPLAYTTYTASGKKLARVVYQSLDFKAPDPGLFEVGE